MITAQDFQTAITSLLLGTPDYPMLRADGTPVVRHTTLSADAAPSAASIHLADLTGFTIGSPVQFIDDTGEQRLYVADGWDGTNPVPIDVTGRTNSQGQPLTGLEFLHTAGTTVATNIFDFAPMEIDQPLTKGDPVIFVRTFHVPFHQVTMPDGNLGTFSLLLQYNRSLTPPSDGVSGARMNANAWAEHQQRATHEDMALINQLLLSNPTLATLTTTPIAFQMAPLGRNGEKTVLTFEPLAEPGAPWHFVATLRATYEGTISRP